MAKKAGSDERSKLLWRLRHRRFGRFIFAGQDALTIRASENGLPASVQAQFGNLRFRVYPVEGGYIYKWPRLPGVATPEGFAVEPGGWDHEHCDGCNRTIRIDGSAWLTTRGSYYELCPYCYRRVRKLAVKSRAVRRRTSR